MAANYIALIMHETLKEFRLKKHYGVSKHGWGLGLGEKKFESWILLKFFSFVEFLAYNKDGDKTLKQVVQVNNY